MDLVSPKKRQSGGDIDGDGTIFMGATEERIHIAAMKSPYCIKVSVRGGDDEPC